MNCGERPAFFGVFPKNVKSEPFTIHSYFSVPKMKPQYIETIGMKKVRLAENKKSERVAIAPRPDMISYHICNVLFCV